MTEPTLHRGEDGILRYTYGISDFGITGSTIRGKEAKLIIDGVEHMVMLTNSAAIDEPGDYKLPLTSERWLNSSVLVLDDMVIGAKPYPGPD